MAITTQAEQTNDRQVSIKIRIVLTVLLFVLNVIIIVVLKQKYPTLGYAVSLFMGVITGYLIMPASPRFRIILLIAAILAVSHFMLVPY